MRFLITRPKPDADALARQLEVLGHKSWRSPVMKIICHKVTPPAPDTVSGVVITSRNALHCLQRHNSLAALTRLPLFAVGKASADRAKALGFRQIHRAAGRADTLPDLINRIFTAASCQPLYYPGGRQKAFDLTPELQKSGFEIIEQIVYETELVTRLAPAAIKALQKSTLDGVLLLSPRSARLFGDLVRANKLEHCLESVACMCLSQNVASAAKGFNWRQTLVADHPGIDNLLSLIAQIDQKR